MNPFRVMLTWLIRKSDAWGHMFAVLSILALFALFFGVFFFFDRLLGLEPKTAGWVATIVVYLYIFLLWIPVLAPLGMRGMYRNRKFRTFLDPPGGPFQGWCAFLERIAQYDGGNDDKGNGS